MSKKRPLPGAANSRDCTETPARDGRDRPGASEPPTPTPAARRAAVEETAGTLTGTYEPGHLKALRDDWPA